MKNILVVAAENSAENYGAQVVTEFSKQGAPVKFFGIGGDKLARCGVEILVHNRDLSVVGIIEVISSIWKLKRYMDLIVKEAVERQAAAALLIDYPHFNLRLAKKLKQAGIPVYYYIGPTVWAWRYGRVKQIRKNVDHIFIIFPFEIDIYKKEQIPFTFTGHPLVPAIKVDIGREDFRGEIGVEPSQFLLTLLPGSRPGEVRRLLSEMLGAVKLLRERMGKEIKTAILLADNIEQEIIETYLLENPLYNTKDIKIIPQNQGHNLIAASDFVISTCGTSNLEIAVLGVPFTAVYKVNKLSYFLGVKLVKIKNYSIVNILAGKRVIEEWIQGECTAGNIAAEVERVSTQPGVKEEMIADFAHIREIVSRDQDPPGMIYRKIAQDLQL